MPRFKDRQIVKRWRGESPTFFKKITNIMVGIGAVSLAVIGSVATLPISLPAIIITAAGYGVAIGTTGAAISKLTKK